ncbi:MAG: DUF488 family protein [Pirellulaceae bacterium]
MNDTIWTIGYGGRQPTEFNRILHEAGVELVADVRISPRGAMGSYTRAKSNDRGIQKLLSEVAIGYEWLPELGNPDRTDPRMAEFRQVIAPEFPRRCRRLVALAEQCRACMLCGCRVAASCHRAIIGEWLQTQGWRVIDL